MNNCIVTKLNVAFSDNNLPVFVHRTFKDYLYTTVDGQYIDVSSLIGSIWMDNIKYDIVFKIREDSNNNTYLFGIRSLNIQVGSTPTKKVSVRVGSTTVTSTNPKAAETDILVSINTKAGSVVIDEETLSASTTSGSTINLASIFTYYGSSTPVSQSANKLALKSIKFTNATTDEVIAELYPCVGANGPCLFDVVSNTEFYEAGGGTLGAE